MNRLGRLWEESGTVEPGSPLIVVLSDGGDVSVSIAPGEGGEVQALYSVAPIADILAEDSPALWFAFAAAVSAQANYTRNGPTRAMQIVATTAAARYEICQRSALA